MITTFLGSARTCAIGYFMGPLACQPCGPSCVTCSNQVYCDTCPTYFYLDPGTLFCKPCHISCGTCASGTTCLLCKPPYYTVTVGSYCANCATGCGTCSGPVGCTSCALGYVMEGSNCLPCQISGCASCQKSMIGSPAVLQTIPCNFCKPKYFSAGSPMLCNLCQSSCSTCTGGLNTHCLSCVSSKYLSSSGQCLNCHLTCLTCDGPLSTHCLSCDYYTHYRGLSGTTCPCAFNSVQIGGVCFPCNNQCRRCYGVTSNCTQCPTASVTHRNTNYTTCSCSYRFFDDNVNSVCQACLLHCLFCINSASCNQCQPTYYLNVAHSACVAACPSGQYASLLNNVCQNCHAACATCYNSTFCDICNSGFTYNNQGSCFYCLCPSCGTTCLGACAIGFFTIQSKCFSNCPVGYMNPSGICISCVPNCKFCTQASNCDQCRTGFYLNKGLCSNICSYFSFRNNTVCSPCKNKQHIYPHSDCLTYAYTPNASIKIFHPFSRRLALIRVDYPTPLQANTLPGNFKLQLNSRGINFSSCFQISTLNISSFSVFYALTNLRCNFVELDILATSPKNSVLNIDGIQFLPLHSILSWPLGAPFLSNKINYQWTEMLSDWTKFTGYLRYFPLTLILIPALRYNIILLYYFPSYPYNTFTLLALFSSQFALTGQYGCLRRDSYPFQLQLNSSNIQLPLGNINFTGLPYVDCGPAIILILAVWLLLPIITLFCKDTHVGLYIVDRVHQGLGFSLAAGSFIGILYPPQNAKGEGIGTGVIILGYLICYNAYILNRVYHTNNTDFEEQDAAIKHPGLLQGLNFTRSVNQKKGFFSILNPKYYRIVNQIFDQLLVLLLIAFNKFWIAQTIFLLINFTFCLIRLVKSPFISKIANLLFGSQIASLILFVLFSIVGKILHQNIEYNSRNELLIQNNNINTWLNLGWLLFTLYLLSLALGVTSQVCALKKAKLILDNKEKESITQLLNAQLLNKNREGSGIIIQELQKLSVMKDGNGRFGVKCSVVKDLIYRVQPLYVGFRETLLPRDVYKSLLYIGVEKGNVFQDLSRIFDQLGSNKIIIRTYSDIDVRTLKPGELVIPRNFYNRLQSDEGSWTLRGDKAFTWTPLNISLLDVLTSR